ncbi:hypothetical protein N7489_008230 [Penicillium chrysogenum]|uniref:uncharacterized protein n=1 Tax=Penicillium chrysogenum TaxID=5076 RepID=UPI00239738D6|nr:uncharacterized protein N7489_008230 [Penicillium chrysogenum]KAJ5238139.1 hypothetical protein N7489_008230 [Penicillium chrysogenum]KAJ5278441.1 hypothetical protein N7524_004594 [Penicillium chrysogenum]
MPWGSSSGNIIYHIGFLGSGIRNDLNLNAEGLSRYGPVIYKDTKHDLIGRPDYSLWYGNKEDVAISVVVVKTKGVESVTSGVSQTLGYMGCVHRCRKDL